MPWLSPFTETFVPLFVAMSPLTVLPIYLNMTQGLDQPAARRLARRAVLTGFVIAIAIVLIGQAMFRMLGITLDDLRVAGGIILLVIAVYDLIFSSEQRKVTELGSDAGVVPLGTPLIVGPATMTACLVLADSHGKPMVVLALFTNLALIALVLHYAQRIERVLTPSVSKAFGKVMSLFLAAIAVAMFRSGVLAFVQAAS
ncbi:MAG: MarC family protein [Myxococcales bacterium]|nr:MAG: MarC family protein [Myxococcales bacterium]